MMLHKLRRAMVNPERGQLTGAVEVDECFVGGHAEGLRGGRERGVKALVVVAVEIRGAGSGRVRLQVIDDAAAITLCGFVTATVAAGTAVHTDVSQVYARHQARLRPPAPQPARAPPPRGRPGRDSAPRSPGDQPPQDLAARHTPRGSAPSTCRSTSTSSRSGSTAAAPRCRGPDPARTQRSNEPHHVRRDHRRRTRSRASSGVSRWSSSRSR